MTISDSKQKVILSQQTAVAQKVYRYVPIQEAWTAFDIQGAMQREGINRMDFRLLGGCLNTLKDARLIVEPKQGFFQRVTQKDREPKQVMHKPIRDIPQPPPTPAPKTSASSELLDELAARARTLAASISEFASDVETVATVLAEESARNAENASRYAQFKELLKGI